MLERHYPPGLLGRRGLLMTAPLFGCFCQFYRYIHSVIGFVLKVDAAGFQREDRVILANPDIRARMHFRAALTNDDIARDDLLATELLDAKTATV